MNQQNTSQNSGSTPLKEEEKRGLIRKVAGHRAFIPTIIFIGVILIFSLSSHFSEQPPEISAVTPSIGEPGDIIIITGENFGDVRKGGEVVIAGVRPVSSAYMEWRDTQITFRVPDEAGSGFVYIVTESGRSNGELFTNKNHVPVIQAGPATPGLPYIDSVSPEKGTIGSRVVITGINFGPDRGKGRVMFSALQPHGDTPAQLNKDTGQSLFIGVSEDDFDYVSWNENEIVLYVPDGATSGSLYVETERGNSNPIYYELIEPVGNKILASRRGYQIFNGIDVVLQSDGNGDDDNWIYLWLPRLNNSFMQNYHEAITEPEPYWEYSPEVSVFYLENLEPNLPVQITQTYWLDRFSLETDIKPYAILPYRTDKKLYRTYTAPDPIVPSDNPVIQAVALTVIEEERNPYWMALRLFQYMQQRYSYRKEFEYGDISLQMGNDEQDSFGYAVIYTALLRSLGIPARPLAGYLVYGNKYAHPHYWAEFYIEGFGWVPVDPALGDGARFDNFPFVDEPESFYFGNIDNQHLLFSRGMVETVQIDPEGTAVRVGSVNPFLEIHKEVSPGEADIKTIWTPLQIIEWW